MPATLEPTSLDAIKAERDRSQTLVDKLFARQSELTKEIQKGDPTSDLNALAAERHEVTKQLAFAESVFAEIEQRLSQLTLNDLHRRFKQTCSEAQAQREAFQRQYTELCLLLGRSVKNTELAVRLYNEIVTRARLVDARDRNLIAEISAPLNPLRELMDSGKYQGTVGLGFDRQVHVVPLFKFGER